MIHQEAIRKWFLESPPGTPVHLVGIAGSGVSCLGHMLLDRGFRVSGSDIASNENTRKLAERGADVLQGHFAGSVLERAPQLVVYSSAIPRDNPELLEARRAGVPVVRRASFLAVLLSTQRPVCVAGMHGKTTTAGLFSYVLGELEGNLSYAVGGSAPQLEVPAFYQTRSEEAPWFVAEVDESDGGLEEFSPEDLILLNIDNEHLDYFVSVESIQDEFRRLIGRTRGERLYCADSPSLEQLFAGVPRAVSFGYHPGAEYRIGLRPSDYRQPGIERFDLWRRGDYVGEFSLQLPGRANVSNAAAVIAWLLRRGYGAGQVAGVLSRFQGVRRRQDMLFEDARYHVIDDYAHHPTEIQETIRAVRRRAPRRLVAVFQPHRYTRTERLMKQFAESFDEADKVWLTEIYAAHEKPIPGVSGQALAEEMAGSGRSPEYEPSLDRLWQRVSKDLRTGDIVLFLGAGEITRAGHQLAASLQSNQVRVSEDFVDLLRRELGPDSRVLVDEPLARRTTLKVGGPADLLVEPSDPKELSWVLRQAAEREIPVFVLGRGSNLLIRDSGIRGVVLSLARPSFARLEIEGDRLVAGAGCRLRSISAAARKAGLAGLEFLEGIPGSLGGALRMNAGAMGAWMFDVVRKVRFLDYKGEFHERATRDLYVEYRGCPLFKDHLALEATLQGAPSSSEEIAERMRRYSCKRWESQPAAASAGCIFKNPGAVPAGRLIEELGMKGARVGGASVSEVHGNFIVNDGSATAEDVLGLIEILRERALRERGIELKTEIQVIGG